jgi:hypothetical protein
MNAPASISITPVRVADLLAEGERMPVYVHVIAGGRRRDWRAAGRRRRRRGVWFGELDEPHTEGQLRVRALDPELVWLAHEHEAWRPRTV